MNETVVEGMFRRPVNRNLWMGLGLLAMILGGIGLAYAVSQGDLALLVVVAVVALIMSAIAYTRMQGEEIAVQLVPDKHLHISGVGYDEILALPLDYQYGIRRVGDAAQALWMVIPIGSDSLILQENITGSAATTDNIPVLQTEPILPTDILISETPFPGALWNIVRVLHTKA